MAVKVNVKDERTVTCPVPASGADTETLGKNILTAAQDGYVLQSASALQGGSQRDPYVIGIEVTLAKP